MLFEHKRFAIKDQNNKEMIISPIKETCFAL